MSICCYICYNEEVIGTLSVWDDFTSAGHANVFVCEGCMKKALKNNGTSTAKNLEDIKELLSD